MFTPSDQHQIPSQFTITISPSQSNPNPNPNSEPNWITDPITFFDTTRSSSSNASFIPTPNQLLSLTVPRKRRRAGSRRRNTTPLAPELRSQVYFSNSTTNPSNGQIVNSGKFNFTYSNFSKQNVPDVSDEIIVINKDATSEALIALTAGFPADVLTDEEIDAGVVSVVGGIEQVNYILIRNHIITRWRENVSTWVAKEVFLNVVPPHCSKLLDSAYNYLNARGYINFGVAPSIKEKIPLEPSKSSVIIIGAGLAGLAAARQLMRFGFKVTVLEGRKRAGGRVYTRKVEGGNKTAAADLGGSVLTGTLGNPLGIIARQLSSSLHKVRDKCPLYSIDGKPVDPDMDSKVENEFNRLLDRASRLRQLMGEVSQDVSLGSALDTFRQDYGDAVNAEELNLFNWHLANLEYANAGLVSKLSLAFWDQDDPYDMGGDHCFLPGGNGRLVQALAENVSIFYEKTVHTVRYSGDGVQVVAGTQVFEGDMVLCTVPLGVLKSGSIKFIPELPQRKLDGIKRLGFGLLNKVAMLFPEVFWGTDLDTFGHLTDDPSRRGEFFLFYSYATVAGGALLIALVAGEAAHTFESMPPTDAVTRVLQILRDIYEPQGISVPEPIQTVCTRWGSDPFSLGSYSNVAVGASGDDYDILAETVGDGRVFFAGEATNRRYPATMHGAFLSGLREAAHMAHYASARSLRKKVEKSPSKNPHSYATVLADLFREPDMEFGSYSIIFDKKNVDPKSMAILRVTFSGPRKRNHEPDQQYFNKLLFQQLQSHFNQRQDFHVYTLFLRQQALELREVRGGDDMRLNYLCEKLGVKLVGRKGLGSMADSIIASIKAERGTRKSASTSLTLKSALLKPKAAISKQKLVRRAKIIRSNMGAGTCRIADVAKVVGNDVAPLSSSNQSMGFLTEGNLNSASISPIPGGAKVVANGVTPFSSASQNVGLVAEASFAGASPSHIAGVTEVVSNGVAPLFSPNHFVGFVSEGNLNLASTSSVAGVAEAMGHDHLPVSSPSQNMGFAVDGNFCGPTVLPTIVVEDNIAGNCNSSATIDVPLDSLNGSLSLPSSSIPSLIPFPKSSVSPSSYDVNIQMEEQL